MNKLISNIVLDKQRLFLTSLINTRSLNFLVMKYNNLLPFYSFGLNSGKLEMYLYGVQFKYSSKDLKTILYYSKDLCFVKYPLYCLSIYCYVFV